MAYTSLRDAPPVHSAISGEAYVFGEATYPVLACKKAYTLYRAEEFFGRSDPDECDQYYAVAIPEAYCDPLDVDHWKELIECPPNSSAFNWPVDLISSAHALVFLLAHARQYDHADMVPLSTLIPSYGYFGIEEKGKLGLDRQRELIVALLQAFDGLDRAGIRYHGFKETSIFFNRNDSSQIMIDFSFASTLSKKAVAVPKDQVSLDFMEPAYLQESGPSYGKLDQSSDRYSIAALLFKLIVGRLPYEGPGQSWANNTSLTEHRAWLTKYFDKPVFIFDSDAASNALGTFTADQEDIARWEHLPSNVRDMFGTTFKPNAREFFRRQHNPLVFDSTAGDAAAGSVGFDPWGGFNVHNMILDKLITQWGSDRYGRYTPHDWLEALFGKELQQSGHERAQRLAQATKSLEEELRQRE
ncbi:MAG: hypothetical protein LKI26_00905 [Bifidobacterium tibiigranuli]|jgi:serine/threonine protein kinase|uniref:hypothetical protein n=1 Tax=Bifidobacterium tibiigranuli TaxID=2172043 RepID=UPI0026E91FF7|nr:hypothetical protein [Bifidobacterium tibiigranuli]MCI1649193.1 hypothetical protein [Bifidobacterium tibiigranuli]MCI2185611.1 hypothetical protein [Bifidobacterium tibiigranuli]